MRVHASSRGNEAITQGIKSKIGKNEMFFVTENGVSNLIGKERLSSRNLSLTVASHAIFLMSLEKEKMKKSHMKSLAFFRQNCTSLSLVPGQPGNLSTLTLAIISVMFQLKEV